MKNKIGILLLALCLLFPLAVMAEEGQDITKSCKLSANGNSENFYRMTDRDTTTYWNSRNGGWLSFTVPEGETFGGVYITWGEDVAPWRLEKKTEDGYVTLYEGERNGYAHQYVPVSEQAGEYRILLSDVEKDKKLHIQELYVLSAGEKPDWAQVWQPTPEKADLMVIPAHPDDELIYMGGTIPYYVQQGKSIVVVYITCQNGTRRSELLDGLWACGLTTYPVLGPFPDYYFHDVSEAYTSWGKVQLYHYVAGVLRQYKPEVVVSHDLKGEYGHGAHIATAKALQKVVGEYVMDATYDPESAEKYGVWEVKKLYLHLYGENQIEMDWRQKLDAFGGETALQLAINAFECHTSQAGYFTVTDEGKYQNDLFGLVYTAVGQDEAKNDFFEHIE